MKSRENFHWTCSPLRFNPISFSKYEESCSDSLWSMKPVCYEGKANKIKNSCTHNSKLVKDKGKVKQEDHKEFGIIDIRVRHKYHIKESEKEIGQNDHSCTAEPNHQVGQSESIYKESEQQTERRQNKLNILVLKKLDSAMILKQMPHVLKLKKN